MTAWALPATGRPALALDVPMRALPMVLVAWGGAWALTGALAPARYGALQLLVCLPLVAAFGLPHGATDWWLASHALPRKLPSLLVKVWPLVFGAFYGVASAVAVLCLLYAPNMSLAAFFAASVWHFGAVDARALGLAGRAGWLACGLVPLGAPLAFHPAQVAAVLQALSTHVAVGTTDVALAGWIALAGAAIAARFMPSRPAAWWRDAGAMLLLAALAPPVPAFTAYFCLVHAPRQMAGMTVFGPAWVAQAAALAAAVLIGLPIGALVWTGAVAPTQAGLQALFMGLAVLTLPHTLCGAWLSPVNAGGGLSAGNADIKLFNHFA